MTQAVPAAMAFDHVFVGATVGGESYWLDGTMLGSRLADIRDVPRYGFVLLLYAEAGTLVDLPRRAHARPDRNVGLAYDMASGPHLPSPFHLTLRYAAMFGVTNRVAPGADYDEKLMTFAEKAAKTWTGSETIDQPWTAHAEIVSLLPDCDKAIELASDPAAYLDSRAMVHFRAGRLDLASADYDAALASAPDMTGSLFMSGIVHAALGNKDKASTRQRAARTIFPGVDQFYQRYGIRP